MIQEQIILKVSDNSGAWTVKCIKVLGGFKRQHAKLSDTIPILHYYLKRIRKSWYKSIFKQHDLILKFITLQKSVPRFLYESWLKHFLETNFVDKRSNKPFLNKQTIKLFTRLHVTSPYYYKKIRLRSKFLYKKNRFKNLGFLTKKKEVKLLITLRKLSTNYLYYFNWSFKKVKINNKFYKNKYAFVRQLWNLIKKNPNKAEIVLQEIKKNIIFLKKQKHTESFLCIKDKIINHMMKAGKKVTVENILLKSFKNLNKQTTKQSIDIFRLCVSNSIPLFKLQISKNKKVKKKLRKVWITPIFIPKFKSRMSLGLKFILKSLKQTSPLKYSHWLVSEILTHANSPYNSNAVKLVDEINETVLDNFKYIKHFRWED